MKANLEVRWHKMPPGSAESLPPSNAKPSTPSSLNGISCSPAPSLLTSNSADMPNNEPPPEPRAPKPFKKRYLASQPPSQPEENSGEAVVVSPEAARACEALLEMARNESRGSRSSDGSDRRASPSETPPLQTLREAVWSKVAGTLLKQEEDKLVVPPKDCPMNLTNQCTIRGQQIIEHIIENILNMPMEGPMDPSSEPITFSLNNNQEQASAQASSDPAVEVADSIKASIYESLKNDLLKGKGTPALPATNGCGGSTNSRTSSTVVASSPPGTPPTQSSSARSPPAPGQSAATHPVSLSLRPTPSKRVQSPPKVTVLPSPPQQPALQSPSSGQDVLRLLGAGQMPINVGNVGNITITKTPRPVGNTASQPPPTLSFAPAASSSSAPCISLSLTRTSSSQVFSLNSAAVPLVLTSQANAVVLSGHQVPGGVVLSTQPRPAGECVVLSHPAGGAAQAGVVLSHPAGGAAQAGVVLSAGSPGLLLSGPPQAGSQMVITQPGAGPPLLLAGLPGGKLVLSTSPQHSPVQPVQVSQSLVHHDSSHHDPNQSQVHHDPNPDPMNLSITKATGASLSSPRQETSPCKRPLSEQDEDDIRRSSRVGKGRRYQEFIEDGRISVGNRKIRRSHRSGDDLGDPELERIDPLPTEQVSLSEDSNCHWKKKMRTASLGENTQVDRMVSRLEGTATTHSPSTSQLTNTANPGTAELDPFNLAQYQKGRQEDFKAKTIKLSGTSRATRQTPLGPSVAGPGKAFDARLNRKTREKF